METKRKFRGEDGQPAEIFKKPDLLAEANLKTARARLCGPRGWTKTSPRDADGNVIIEPFSGPSRRSGSDYAEDYGVLTGEVPLGPVSKAEIRCLAHSPKHEKT